MDGDGVNGSVGSEFRIRVSEFRCMTGVTKLRLSVGWHPRNGGPHRENGNPCVCGPRPPGISRLIQVSKSRSPMSLRRCLLLGGSLFQLRLFGFFGKVNNFRTLGKNNFPSG